MHPVPPGKGIGVFPEAKQKSAEENIVRIPLDFEWNGMHIVDEFLWDSSNTDPELMKLFSFQMIFDLLGRQLDDLSEASIEGKKAAKSIEFCNLVTLEIIRNTSLFNLAKKTEWTSGGPIGNGITEIIFSQ